MNTRFLIPCAAVLAAALAGCSGTPKEPDCYFPNSGNKEKAPAWVCDAPVAGVAVGAVGSAPKSAAGLDFMKQMAATSARVQLAQNLRVQVQNMIRQYAETTGAGRAETVDLVNASVTKQITNETLAGTKIVRSATAPDGTVYVLVGLDETAARQLTETAVKTSMNNDQAAWQQFRSEKGQNELAAEIAKQQFGK